jgi:hypothetical protein
MSIIPVDDVETLYRRIRHIEGLYVVQADGTVRVSSAAFSDPLFRPSVDRAKFLHNDPKKAQRDPSDGVVSIVARNVRSIDTVVQNDKAGKIIQTFDVDIEHVPVLDHPTLPDNPAHAEIYTNPHCPNKSVFRKLAERLAQLANERPWEIELQDIS